jgi:hypothetical protein
MSKTDVQCNRNEKANEMIAMQRERDIMSGSSMSREIIADKIAGPM